ncbi:hypothetical protein HPB49_026469 [Dermacentor silvarum]|nr:hypothetical protein HPB49_026469 [Dermacentor silvarum]
MKACGRRRPGISPLYREMARPKRTLTPEEEAARCAATAATPDAHAFNASSRKLSSHGSHQESDASSATGVSTGQTSVTPVTCDIAFGPSLSLPGTAAQKYAAEDVIFAPNIDTKMASAAPLTNVHVPVSTDASKAPNTSGALVDKSSRADHRNVVVTLAPLDAQSARPSGRSRRKRRRRNSKWSLSSASSTSSRASKQGPGEGERKVEDAPSTSKPSRYKTSLEKDVLTSVRAEKNATTAEATAATMSLLPPAKMSSVPRSSTSGTPLVTASEAAPQDPSSGITLPSHQTSIGTAIGGVFTGNYDDSSAPATPTKMTGTEAKDWADAQGGKETAADLVIVAPQTSCNPLRASSGTEHTAPETAPASEQGVGAAASPDGEASNLAVGAGTITNEGAASQQGLGSVFATITATSYVSEDDMSASHGAVPADSVGAVAPEGHLAPEAQLGQKVIDGAVAPSSSSPTSFPKEFDSEGAVALPTDLPLVLRTNQALPIAESLTSPRNVVEEREPDRPPTAFADQQGTSHPAPAGRGQEDRTGRRKWRQSGNKATEESGASEVHVGSTRGALKSSFGSPGQSWSFYPLNVTFITEKDTRQECLVYGSMICVISVIFSVLVAVLIMAFYPNRALTPLACVTPECVAARDYLASLINVSRDACGDFYGYVCDSWIARRKDAGSFREDSVAASLAIINESLWRQNAEGDSSDLRLMRRVYQGCRFHAPNSSNTATLRATLESARKLLSWAPIRDCRDYHSLVALLVRTSLLVGFHTVLVTELFSENGRTVLRFACGKSLVRKLTIADRRIDLQVTLKTIVSDDSKDIPKIMEVDELAGDDLDGSDCAANVEHDDVVGSLSQFVGGIVPGVNASAWAEAVQDVLASSGENASQLSAVASGVAGFRRAFLDVTSAAGVEVSALYLATHLDVEIVALELSRRMVHSDPKGAARFCVVLSQTPLAHSWPSLVAKILNVSGSEEVLRAMFDQIKATARETTMFAWLPEVMRRVAGGKIDGVNLAVTSEDMSSARMANATDPYASLITNPDERNATFVELFVKAMTIAHGLRIRSPPTRAQSVISQLEARHEVAYSSATSSMVVPTLYRRAPHLYVTGVPSHFNYATVGAVLATRIVDIVGPALAMETVIYKEKNRDSGAVKNTVRQ